MSRRIFVRLTNRRPEDVPRFIKMIADACPPDADVQIDVECQQSEPAPGGSQRVDEHLGAKVSEFVGGELDRLAELAAAVEKYKEDRSKEAGQGHAEELAGYSEKLKKWFADRAREGWTCAVQVITAILLKGSGST